jgi:hypothetical protein
LQFDILPPAEFEAFHNEPNDILLAQTPGTSAAQLHAAWWIKPKSPLSRFFVTKITQVDML